MTCSAMLEPKEGDRSVDPLFNQGVGLVIQSKKQGSPEHQQRGTRDGGDLNGNRAGPAA